LKKASGAVFTAPLWEQIRLGQPTFSRKFISI